MYYMYILYIFSSFELSKVPSSETLIQLKHAVALSFGDASWYYGILGWIWFSVAMYFIRRWPRLLRMMYRSPLAQCNRQSSPGLAKQPQKPPKKHTKAVKRS